MDAPDAGHEAGHGLSRNAVPTHITIGASPWAYRGEGGANLVITLPDRNLVLRFAKSKYADKDVDTKIGEIAYFANEVIRPLLGHVYMRPLSIGSVDDADFERVRTSVQPFRPNARLKKDMKSKKVILSPDCAFLTPEYAASTFGDTLSFEIKPKQGWHSLKTSCAVDLCHRCLKQHAKLFQGEIDSISKYCPLDLFSGDPMRTKRAIFDLFEFPCNRFKIFKNGQLIYTENIGTPEDAEHELDEFFDTGHDLKALFGNEPRVNGPLHYLAALLSTALLTPLEEQKQVIVNEDHLTLDIATSERNKTCDTRSHPLPPNSILQRLLALQRQTEISDHEAQVICDRLLNDIEDIEGLHQLVMWHPSAKLEHELTPGDIEDVVALQRFLLSVTAKDVSLLMTFRRIADSSQAEVDQLPVLDFKTLNRSYRLMLSVIDVDPKSVHRISSWVKRKEKWLKLYFSSLSRKDPLY